MNDKANISDSIFDQNSPVHNESKLKTKADEEEEKITSSNMAKLFLTFIFSVFTRHY